MSMKNLEKLRVLTENITREEEKRIQELSLYQSFFKEIPVRTFVWSVDEKLRIRVKNKKSLKGNISGKVLKNGTLNDAFTCPKMNELNIQYHQSALKGFKQTYLSYEDDSTFLTTLIPVKEDGSSVIYGCSWDVSTVIEILDLTKTLPEDCSLSLTKVIEKNPMYKLVNQLRSA
jgi:hypothetical protein